MTGQRRDWVDCGPAAVALRDFNAGMAFIALDFETTGLSPQSDRICEFGAVKFNREGILAEFGCLCDPGIAINPEASRVSGISDAMVRGQTPESEILVDFIAFLRTCPLVAHNAPFDIGFLRAGLGRLGLPSLSNPIYDTRLLAKQAFPGRGSYSLQVLVSGLGIDPGQAHRALDDAKTCMSLFLRCLEAIGAH